MKRYNLSELEKEAIELGAIYFKHYFIPVCYTNPNRQEVWATHFFNSDHKEVCMLINSAALYELCGLTIFEQPRIWGEKFFNGANMGKPIDIHTFCVKYFN